MNSTSKLTKVTPELVEVLLNGIQERKLASLSIRWVDTDFIADYVMLDESKVDYSLEQAARAMNILNEFTHALKSQLVQKFFFTFSPETLLVSSAYLPISERIEASSMSFNPFEYAKVMIDYLNETELGQKMTNMYHKEPGTGRKQSYKQATVLSAMMSVLDSFEK